MTQISSRARRYALIPLHASVVLIGVSACSNVVPYDRLTPGQQLALINASSYN